MEEIDIIIPAFNAHKTIKNTLFSIAMQEYTNQIKVYIINDCSLKDYQEEINDFKSFLNIEEIILEKNGGPGIARQKGIDVSKGKYLIFIDADDIFYDCNAIKTLYDAITSKKLDLVVTSFYEEIEGKHLFRGNNFVWTHGKIYKRVFLKKKNIKFNNTRYNEDVAFNQLIMYNSPKCEYVDKITYIWKNNSNSITRENDSGYLYWHLKYYTYNHLWAVNIAIKNNCDKYKIGLTIFNVCLDLYYEYLFYKTDDILKWSYKIVRVYEKVKKYVKEDEKQKIIELKVYELIEENKIYLILSDISLNEFIDLVKIKHLTKK